MTTINVPLSDDTKSFLESQAAKAGSTPSDLVQKLILNYQISLEKASLEAKLLEGIDQLDRGLGRELPSDYFDQLRSRILEKYGEKREGE